jgi:hypothetical protein
VSQVEWERIARFEHVPSGPFMEMLRQPSGSFGFCIQVGGSQTSPRFWPLWSLHGDLGFISTFRRPIVSGGGEPLSHFEANRRTAIFSEFVGLRRDELLNRDRLVLDEGQLAEADLS